MHTEIAASVLSRAFSAYPLVNYLFVNATAQQRSALPWLVEAMIKSHLVRRWPVLGAWSEEKLVGAAVISSPDDRVSRQEADLFFNGIEQMIGTQAASRFDAYSNLCNAGLPTWPHHYLGILGVDPDYRGRHHGRALIAAAQALAAQDPQSEGIVLNTESPDNLTYYEQAGFQTLHSKRFDSITTWTMTWHE